MNQENYLKARVAERTAEKQPSKEHQQPIVKREPETGKPIYREEQ